MPAKRGGSSTQGKSGPATAKQEATKTPSGYTYDEFLSKSVEEREQIVLDILENDSITPPSYLEDSVTSKLLYALGMNGKPRMVDDNEFDALPGEEMFRTVSSNKYLDRNEIFDQIGYGDYTRLSDSGGSVHGRGIYAAAGGAGLTRSLGYGISYEKSGVMRSKFSPNAKIAYESDLDHLYSNLSDHFLNKTSSIYKNPKHFIDGDDEISVAAIIHGYDGWRTKGSYRVILNRSNLVVSKTYKKYPKNGYNSTVAWSDLENSN